jgi:predicted nucleotidyltransferase
VNGLQLLTDHQRTIVARVLEEERRDHVVVYLGGAHAYGFPSPDSDLDLKSIHVAPTRELLGLRPRLAAFDRAEVLEGVEIDYTSNELGSVVAGVLSGNGNYLERILGTTPVFEGTLLEELRSLARAAVSRKFVHHYRGFATGQRRALLEKPTAKRALYVLRTTLTGAHLLATGELVTDVTCLLDDYGFAEARELVRIKQAGERVGLNAEDTERWSAVVERSFAVLDARAASSALPESATNEAELEAWLVATRVARLS